METVKRLDLGTGKISLCNASEWAVRLKQNPHAGDHSVFFSAEYGDPIAFVAGSEGRAPYFRRWNDYGRENAEAYRLENKGKRVFGEKPKTLLLLDPVFSYKRRGTDFGPATRQNPKIWMLQQWIAANDGDFEVVKIDSVRRAVTSIRRLHNDLANSEKAVPEQCFAYFGGVVYPYDVFYYNRTPKSRNFGAQQEKLGQLYRDLKTRKHGVAVYNDSSKIRHIDPNRMTGLPVLMKVEMMSRGTGNYGVKCKPFVVPQDQGDRRPPEEGYVSLHMARAVNSRQADLRKKFNGRSEAWVLGTPSVTVGREDHVQARKPGHKLVNMRIVVNNANLQVMPAGEQEPKKAKHSRRAPEPGGPSVPAQG